MTKRHNELYCGLGYSGRGNIMGIRVMNVFPNSAAESIGLQPQDTIVAVQEKHSDNWQLTSTAVPIEKQGNTRGIAGTQIRLQILRPQEGKAAEEFETDWVRREMVITDISKEITVDSSHECGLIGSLTPPTHINIASSEPDVTPHSIPRL